MKYLWTIPLIFIVLKICIKIIYVGYIHGNYKVWREKNFWETLGNELIGLCICTLPAYLCVWISSKYY